MITDKQQLYSIAMLAFRHKPDRPDKLTQRLQAGFCLAYSRSEAIAEGYDYASKQWPTEDGWSYLVAVAASERGIQTADFE